MLLKMRFNDNETVIMVDNNEDLLRSIEHTNLRVFNFEYETAYQILKCLLNEFTFSELVEALVGIQFSSFEK